MDLINKDKGSTVLDLGCGNGELTNQLKKEGYKAFGLDASSELLEIAKERYPELDFIRGDASDFSLKEPVDVIFSNAVFHWIKEPQQLDLLKSIYKNLKPGGELIFECGGIGNNQIIHQNLEKVFMNHGYQYEVPFYFPSIGEYSNLLEDVGFLVVFAKLFERPTKLKGNDGLKDWIEMFIREPLNQIESQKQRERIVAEAVSVMKDDLYKNGKWYADYVRLRMKAIKI